MKKHQKKEIKVCLVGSSGGHLTHLYILCYGAICYSNISYDFCIKKK